MTSVNNARTGLIEKEINYGLSSRPEFEIQSVSRDLKTKQELTAMIKPLVQGFSENTIHTTKLQNDYDELVIRVKSMEVIFNADQHKNWIYDKLTSMISDEVRIWLIWKLLIFL